MEQVAVEVEAIGQAMRRINAHHQCTVPELRQPDASSGSEARFPHSPFAREQENSHANIISARLIQHVASTPFGQ